MSTGVNMVSADTSTPDGTRSYVSQLRQQQAAATRERVVRAAAAAVSFGAEPGAAVADTEQGRQMMTATTAVEAARRSAEVVAAVNEGSHGVWMAFSEASRNDEGLTRELRRLTEEVAVQTELALEQWRAHGWLREDLSIAELARRAGAICSV